MRLPLDGGLGNAGHSCYFLNGRNAEVSSAPRPLFNWIRGRRRLHAAVLTLFKQRATQRYYWLDLLSDEPP